MNPSGTRALYTKMDIALSLCSLITELRPWCKDMGDALSFRRLFSLEFLTEGLMVN